ncbi:MAG: glycosyltransferase family 4 protein [Anaerolineae bacterium]|nr:glycosyltransferase family 4 protein [Anaerolineae bacterium]
MRIAIDLRLTYYRQGGIARYGAQIAQALPALDPDNRYLLLHSRKHAEARAAPPPAPNAARASLWTPAHHRLEAYALGAELLPRRVDLLHSPDFIPPHWGARRYVITVHDLNFLHYPQFLTAEARAYYNGQIARAVRQADHILADSEATKADLVDLLGAPPQKVTVHMLGVDPAFAPQPAAVVEAVRARYGLPAGYLLFVGTFEPRKNLPGLLRAYRLLRDDLPDAPSLALVGRRGWLYADVFDLVRALDLTAHVRWLEDAPGADLPALYSGATALVMPSFYEGFGLPALEAMACGAPVVASNRASLPEVVGPAGVLVNPDDAAHIADGLRRVVVDSELRASLAREGLARARSFTWRRTAEVVLRVYRAVLGQ